VGSASLLGIPHHCCGYGRLLILQPGSCCPESPYRANATADEEYNTAACHRTNPVQLADAGISRPRPAVFLQQNLWSDWVRPWTSHDDHDASRCFCIAAADSAFHVDARTGFAKLSTCASWFLRTLLKVRSEWSHIIRDASVGPAWWRNRRTLF
jgi:hypothetical protein